MVPPTFGFSCLSKGLVMALTRKTASHKPGLPPMALRQNAPMIISIVKMILALLRVFVCGESLRVIIRTLDREEKLFQWR
jgi:hypothetical protein